jgi:hypothetical protein
MQLGYAIGQERGSPAVSSKTHSGARRRGRPTREQGSHPQRERAGCVVPAVVAQRRWAIRALAGRHGVAAMRWWPAVTDLGRMDFLVEGNQISLGRFRMALERLLGCRVAIYPIERLPAEARAKIWAETVGI